MTKFTLNSMALVLSAVVLSGCSVNRGFEDLDQFMATADKAPGGPVDPVPVFEAYEAFTYSAANRRDPFSPPVEIDLAKQPEDNPDLKPDLERPKELLESFPITSLSMVGTLRKAEEGPLFALVSDGSGGIHRVKEGQYLGKSFGKIISIDELAIKVMEIVPNGHGGWLERPRTMGLEGSEQ